MRNYVIINGVNSLTIKGLAINELPPIVKAPMRVLQEEIDGRDGDIITDLGYGAYDKIMTIGLYDGYDINEIIAFFNNEGTIVFSDEADKYYNFKIIEQIDYERLIKFRTASITFHVQPFKYPLTETPVEITNEYVEAEGTNLTLTPTADAPMEIDLKGNTSQASDPTPDSPVDVNVVSGDNTIEICGKNLASDNDSSTTRNFAIGNVEEGVNYTLYLNIDGTDINGNIKYDNASGTNAKSFYTATGKNVYTFTSSKTTKIYMNCYGGTNFNGFTEIMLVKGTYTLQTIGDYEPYTGTDYEIDLPVENLLDKNTLINNKGLNTSNGKDLYDANGYSVSQYIKIHKNTDYSITNNSNDTMTRVFYYDENKNFLSTERPVTLINSSTATYIRLQDNTSHFEDGYVIKESGITPIELCKIGNYQDYIYKTDKWYLHKEIGKVVLDGSENWQEVSSAASGTKRFYFDTSGINNQSGINNTWFYSDKFKPLNWDKIYSSDTTTKNAICVYAMQRINIRIDNTYASDVATFKTWLGTNKPIVYYVLATPTDTEITDTTLLGQLEAIKNMASYDGTTNISQENNDYPFIISAKAMKQGSGTATITNSGNIYSKPTIDIEGTGIVDVYIGANQIFSVNVDEEVIIDSTNLEAYKPDGTLANRNVTGNIANLKLPTGNSTISVDGDIDKATITNYTRWL